MCESKLKGFENTTRLLSFEAMKTFDIPVQYRSSFIGPLKSHRKKEDPRKKDFSPSIIDFGPLEIVLGRHFGFCYGVENAIEIAYKAIRENEGKRIFMLSQMIHNPVVNQDLQEQGLSFILDTEGNTITPWEEVKPTDIVIIPAFGTTLETKALLETKGVEQLKYNTTCPFVEKVWKMAGKLGAGDYSIIIHGKSKHEETKATFSHSKAESKSVVIKDIEEAKIIGDIILGKRPVSDFNLHFKDKCSDGFDPATDLTKLGVINQTTMLASETHEISQYFRQVMIDKYGEEDIKSHFADTRDTLCYATNDNQQSTYQLLETQADLAIIVGGYNSSNTSHIVDLCATKFPSYFVNGADNLISDREISHFDYHKKELTSTENYLNVTGNKPRVVITSGASCPDKIVEEVIDRLLSFFPQALDKQSALEQAGITS
mgnify:CR=1 FL=1